MDNSDTGAGPDPSAHRWGPDRRWRWTCLAIAVACVAWRVLDSDPENRLVAVVLAVAGLLGALVLTRARVRLVADSRGITIIGPLRTRAVTWSAVRTITTPRRGRFGRRGASLEIEIADDDAHGLGALTDIGTAPGGTTDTDTVLYAFGSFELGGEPAAVGRTLRRLRG